MCEALLRKPFFKKVLYRLGSCLQALQIMRTVRVEKRLTTEALWAHTMQVQTNVQLPLVVANTNHNNNINIINNDDNKILCLCLMCRPSLSHLVCLMQHEIVPVTLVDSIARLK